MSYSGQSYNQPLSTLTILAPPHWQKIQFNISEAATSISNTITPEKRSLIALSSFNYMPTEQMIADGFTKALPGSIGNGNG
jgi:hypothetical protein